jgi:glycosyltransferase involved in cell wall biosynthesis
MIIQKTPPRVSVGLPVFNGADYLPEALDSLLAQTYTDFELIISDNASTDSTPKICQEYAAQDSRIHYQRNPKNIGAMQNWYHSFRLSSGEYFVGAAHDDRYHPKFLSRSLAMFEEHPTAVVCYPKTKVIDEHGNFVHNFERAADTTSPQPHVRLYNVISIDLLCIQLLGMFRASAFGKTQSYTGYYGCDRNALAELALLGPLYEVPEYLFYHRLHPKALGAARHSGRSVQELLSWDPGTNWAARFPTLTRFRNYFASVARMPLRGPERLLCYGQLMRLIADKLTDRIKRRTSA